MTPQQRRVFNQLVFDQTAARLDEALRAMVTVLEDRDQPCPADQLTRDADILQMRLATVRQGLDEATPLTVVQPCASRPIPRGNIIPIGGPLPGIGRA